MSRRRTGQSTAISLFPFLAVLICTMGALILLLLVTTRQIRAQEIAREQAKLEDSTTSEETTGSELTLPLPVQVERPAPAAPDPERIRKLKQSRDQDAEIAEKSEERRLLADKLDRERTRLAEARREFEALQSRMDGLQDRLQSEQADQDRQRRQTTDLTEEEKKLLEDLEHARRKLTDLKARQQNAQGEFALIPFDGKSGTTRRPLFIECTERGFRILPEDILLTPEDMNGFSERVNPLLAANEALTAYWSGKADVRPSEIDSQNPPYTLLIVRPSGTVAYYLARRFLNRIKEPFGYELVEEDYPLHVPTPDPQAKRIALHAIELTLASRDEILQELAERKLRSREAVEVETFNNDVHTLRELEKVREMLPNRDGRSVAPPLHGSATPPVSHNPRSSLPDTRSGRSIAPNPQPSPAHSPTDVNRQTPGFPSGEFANPQLTPSETEESTRRFTAKEGGGDASLSEGELGEVPPSIADKDIESTGSTGKFRPVTRQRTWPETSAEQTGTEREEVTERLPSEAPPQVIADRAQRDEPPRPGRQQAVPAGSIPRQVVARHRWGGNSAAGIGMQKKILVEVEADKLVVEEELEVPLLEGESREMLARRLLGAVDWAASQWGEPHKNYYWIPVVRFQVHPGCMPQQARLQGVLQDWGVNSTVEFLKPSQPK